MKLGVDIAGTGYVVLDRVYEDNQRSFEALGGSCGNVLLSLAMLNHSVVPLLALGDDKAGEYLISEFVAGGADTQCIFQHPRVASPVLAQRLDTASGQHWFSFLCPETNEELPRYKSIDECEVDWAWPVLSACSVFYCDRLSDAILRAMETAAQSGAIVYFEPASIDDEHLLERALKLTSILKYCFDQLGERITEADLKRGAISIITYGADGLELRQGARRLRCPSIPAAVVRDTCGCGDMVSVGAIDWILGHGNCSDQYTLDCLLGGVIAGQRLASANCAFIGARGLFKQRGPRIARIVLDHLPSDALSNGFSSGSRFIDQMQSSFAGTEVREPTAAKDIERRVEALLAQMTLEEPPALTRSTGPGLKRPSKRRSGHVPRHHHRRRGNVRRSSPSMGRRPPGRAQFAFRPPAD
jgi:fructokinase